MGSVDSSGFFVPLHGSQKVFFADVQSEELEV